MEDLVQRYYNACKNVSFDFGNEIPQEKLDELSECLEECGKHFSDESMVYAIDMACLVGAGAGAENVVVNNEQLINILCNNAEIAATTICTLALNTTEKIREKLVEKLLPKLLNLIQLHPTFDLLGASKNILYSPFKSQEFTVNKSTVLHVMQTVMIILKFDVAYEKNMLGRILAMVFYLCSRNPDPIPNPAFLIELIIIDKRPVKSLHFWSGITDLLRFFPEDHFVLIDEIMIHLCKSLQTTQNPPLSILLNICGNIGEFPKDYLRTRREDFSSFIENSLSQFSSIDPKMESAVKNLHYDIINGTNLTREATIEFRKMTSSKMHPRRITDYFPDAYKKLLSSLESEIKIESETCVLKLLNQCQ
jgi:hypothetical protein